jgi:hypothetical protein
MFDFGLINYLIRLKFDKIVLVSVSQLKWWVILLIRLVAEQVTLL